MPKQIKDEEWVVGADGDSSAIVTFQSPDLNTSGKRLRSEADPNLSAPVKKTARRTLPDDEEMKDVDMTPAAAPSIARLAASSGDAGRSGTQETDVDPVGFIERNFFPETITASLPLTVYFSANDVSKAEPQIIRFKCNTMQSIFADTTLVGQTINSPKSIGISNCNSQQLAGTNYTALVSTNNFPAVIVGSTAKTATKTSFGAITDAAVVPARRSAYNKIYDAYHVVECKWTVDFEFASNQEDGRGIVFYQYDTVTTNSLSDKIPTNRTVNYYKQWPMVQQVMFEKKDSTNFQGSWRKSISGVWRPGEQHKNVVNEEDIKTWNTTGAVPSNGWVEDLVLLIMQDDYAAGSAENSFNVRISLEYIVQFKDVKQQIRYPHSTDGVINAIAYPTDVIQVPNTTEVIP